MTRQPGVLRVAQLSFWFVHADQFCAQALATPNVELVGVWDNDREPGERKAAEIGVPFEPDRDRLLARPDLNAVSLCAEPFHNPELVEATAQAGKHILIKKPMAADLEGAARIVGAVERHGVHLMPAFNLRYHPVSLKLKELVETGAVGLIGRVRRLHGHSALYERGGFEYQGIARAGRWGDPVAERRDSLFFAGSHGALWFQWMFGVLSGPMRKSLKTPI